MGQRERSHASFFIPVVSWGKMEGVYPAPDKYVCALGGEGKERREHFGVLEDPEVPWGFVSCLLQSTCTWSSEVLQNKSNGYCSGVLQLVLEHFKGMNICTAGPLKHLKGI